MGVFRLRSRAGGSRLRDGDRLRAIVATYAGTAGATYGAGTAWSYGGGGTTTYAGTAGWTYAGTAPATFSYGGA